MKRLLLKQATYLPLIYFLPIIIAGFFAQEYYHWGQHVSELALNANPVAGTIFNIGAALTGISLVLFGIGLLLCFKGRFILSSVLTIVFGTTFIFNAIFTLGSPWHGLYGIGLCVILVPFCFLYEKKDLFEKGFVHTLSIIIGLMIFIYFWLMIAGLDPVNLRGLAQRFFALIVFGWYSFISFHLVKAASERS